ncbi:MAG: hypothetical protein HUU50_07785 [Candidatus Brocadiae bacterium]|nr:hypothetical protein [Candidatus Brocadiia bacterium]
MKEFRDAIPKLCKSCKLDKECRGGCKASAEVSTGPFYNCDPLLSFTSI